MDASPFAIVPDGLPRVDKPFCRASAARRAQQGAHRGSNRGALTLGFQDPYSQGPRHLKDPILRSMEA